MSAERNIVAKVEARMEDVMSKYDPSHDAWHVKRVRKTALSIANQLDPKPDLLVVEIAALMHDLADRKYVKLPEETTLYQYFTPFFDSLSIGTDGNRDDAAAKVLTEARLQLVVRIIENVSWTTEKKLVQTGAVTDWHRTCAELHCVQDADRLDAIGAFGIMRCSAYSAVSNRPLYIPPEEGAGKEDATAIGHFYDKLLLIRERLKTGVGKRMGDQRHKLMLQFLQGLNDEAAGISR